MDRLIKKVKNFQKQKLLSRTWDHKYAFVGVGKHSLGNLYPVIDYLKVPLKYIVTHSEANALKVDAHFQNSIGTNNLEQVLNDKEVKGIFICASPQAHFDLIEQCLEHGKHVLVEKPPCFSTNELKKLIALAQRKQVSCEVGLQKVFAPVYTTLKEHYKTPISYNYKYLTGAYPEGDLLSELFIHPLHLVKHLFGPYSLEGVSVTTTSKGSKSYFLQLKHEHLIGSVELSSEYSWNSAREELNLNTSAGFYQTTNCDELKFTPKRGNLLGIPKEKISNKNTLHELLVQRNGFVPTMENGNHYLHGYYGEILSFVEHCEKGGEATNNSIESLLHCYQIMDKLRAEES